MMNEKLLTVIVPVYNKEKYLIRCVKSILSQTYRNIEVVLVDDGSTDYSGELCENLSMSDSRIICVHKANEGLGRARQTGVSFSKGEYVTFVDADDWIEANMYEELLYALAEIDADIITSGLIQSDGNLRQDRAEEGIYEGRKLEELCKGLIYDVDYRMGSVLVSCCNKIYKKELIKKYLESVPPKCTFYEDIIYSLPPFYDSQKVIITHKKFYHYELNDPQSMSKDIIHYENFHKLFETFSIARSNYSMHGRIALISFNLFVSSIFYNCLLYYITRYGSCMRLGELKIFLLKVSKEIEFQSPVTEVLDVIPIKR